MGVLLGLFVIFLILLVVLLGLSIGVAFLLAWLLPAVGLEMALLVAVIAVGQAMLMLGRIMGTLPVGPDLEEEREPPLVILDRELSFPRRRRKRS